jgi:hypothetical protein
MTASEFVWTWSNVTKECMNGIWKVGHDFKGFDKDKTVSRNHKTPEMENNFNLGVNEGEIEEHLMVDIES